MLTNNDRTPSQEHFIIENELLNQKVTAKLIDEGEQATTAFNQEAEHTENNANCRPTNIVAHCKGYKAPKEQFSHTNKGAPDLLLTEIARWRPQTSNGFHRPTPQVLARAPAPRARAERMFLLLQSSPPLQRLVARFSRLLRSACNDLSQTGYKQVFVSPRSSQTGEE